MSDSDWNMSDLSVQNKLFNASVNNHKLDGSLQSEFGRDYSCDYIHVNNQGQYKIQSILEDRF